MDVLVPLMRVVADELRKCKLPHQFKFITHDNGRDGHPVIYCYHRNDDIPIVKITLTATCPTVEVAPHTSYNELSGTHFFLGSFKFSRQFEYSNPEMIESIIQMVENANDIPT